MKAVPNLASIVVNRSDDASFEMEAEFDRCFTSLYRYFAVRLGDAHLAEDFMQQLWVRAQRLRDLSTGSLEARLRTTAKNLVRSHWRQSKSRGVHVSLPNPEAAALLAQRLVTEEMPRDFLEDAETRDQLLLAITELPADQQELIVEHYFCGRAHAELAERGGVSVRAVEGRLYRARRALREKLQHLEPF